MIKHRLLDEAKVIIGQQSHIPSELRENLIVNVKYFLSIISRDSIIKECFWEWYKDDDGDEGIDLVWDWENVKGRFGIDIHNGHGFSFEFGTGGAEWCGGSDGVDGFYPEFDVDEFESVFITNHLAE